MDSRGCRSLDEFSSEDCVEDQEQSEDEESEGVIIEEDDSDTGDEVYLL